LAPYLDRRVVYDRGATFDDEGVCPGGDRTENDRKSQNGRTGMLEGF
jgi:hypothetical protein